MTNHNNPKEPTMTVSLLKAQDAHKGHSTVTCQAGAPGTGTCDYCWDCKEYFNDNTRILTLDEVR
jgi:hypothetical protein